MQKPCHFLVQGKVGGDTLKASIMSLSSKRLLTVIVTVGTKGLYYWISIAIKMQLLQIFNNCKYSIESYAIALLHYCNRIWEKSAIMEMQ